MKKLIYDRPINEKCFIGGDDPEDEYQRIKDRLDHTLDELTIAASNIEQDQIDDYTNVQVERIIEMQNINKIAENLIDAAQHTGTSHQPLTNTRIPWKPP